MKACLIGFSTTYSRPAQPSPAPAWARPPATGARPTWRQGWQSPPPLHKVAPVGRSGFHGGHTATTSPTWHRGLQSPPPLQPGRTGGHIASLLGATAANALLLTLLKASQHHAEGRPASKWTVRCDLAHTQGVPATAGWPTATFSISIELIHSPPDLITSLDRSVICWSSK